MSCARLSLCLTLLGVGVACEGRAAREQSAPAYEAQDMEGARVSLASLRGQVVVLNIWATWCQPCREEIPQLQALHEAQGGDGVRVIGVSVDEAGMRDDIRDFAREHRMDYTIWLDPDREVSLAFQTVGVPETFVIGRDGRIVRRLIGALRTGDTTLRAAVREARGS